VPHKRPTLVRTPAPGNPARTCLAAEVGATDVGDGSFGKAAPRKVRLILPPPNSESKRPTGAGRKSFLVYSLEICHTPRQSASPISSYPHSRRPLKWMLASAHLAKLDCEDAKPVAGERRVFWRDGFIVEA